MTPVTEHMSTLSELIESRAREAPGAAVLRSPGRGTLDARSLLELVEGLRTVLRERGVGPTGRVALVTRNGPEAAAAFLGIASSAACAPLNPSYTSAELEFALTDLRADAVVVETGLETAARTVAHDLDLPLLELVPVPEAPSGVFRIGGSSSPGRTETDRPLSGGISLLLHTSGTTARPKLVPLTHATSSRRPATLPRRWLSTRTTSASTRCRSSTFTAWLQRCSHRSGQEDRSPALRASTRNASRSGAVSSERHGQRPCRRFIRAC